MGTATEPLQPSGSSPHTNDALDLQQGMSPRRWFKALGAPGPVVVGIPVDNRDNHQLMEIVHPEALD